MLWFKSIHHLYLTGLSRWLLLAYSSFQIILALRFILFFMSSWYFRHSHWFFPFCSSFRIFKVNRLLGFVSATFELVSAALLSLFTNILSLSSTDLNFSSAKILVYILTQNGIDKTVIHHFLPSFKLLQRHSSLYSTTHHILLHWVCQFFRLRSNLHIF